MGLSSEVQVVGPKELTNLLMTDLIDGTPALWKTKELGQLFTFPSLSSKMGSL